ncbi:hypothetical protein VTO42DRAFT_3820 [Malbranchea cinnamomea]
MSTPSVSALSAYRQLLRATRIAFDGDMHTLLAARAECRRHFDQNRRLGVDTPMHIQNALEAAEVLRKNIVQGVKTEKLNEKGEVEDSYFALRIHDEIERGDNDTIKMKGKDKPATLKPCSAK